MRTHLEKRLVEMDGIIFGMHTARLPNTCYFALPDIEGETLVTRLKIPLAIASGATCSSATMGKFRVLDAMEVEPILARCAVRISLGSSNTLE